jgi:hypothetical protein
MNRWLTPPLRKEVIMSIHATRLYFGRHNFILVTKTAFVLLGLAVLNYFAVAIGGKSRLSPDGISGPAAASQISNSNASIGTADAPTGGVAATAVRAAAQPDVGYFPNGYVNQATKLEDPIATF